MPVITYPGVTGVLSHEYTTSVGITPGIVGIIAYPDSSPDVIGDLLFGDGINDPIPVPNCFLQYQEITVSGRDYVKIIRLLDRRWQWREGFPIDGHYNQVGPNQKYIPWTVRSPYQLARLLLAEMGEYSITGAIPAGTIDLPGGLAAAPVAGLIPPLGPDDTQIDPVADYLALGQNLPQTLTNQLAAWVKTPAALALAALCELYGRVVILDPLTNKVRIEKLGSGTDIPDGGEVQVSTGDSTTGEPRPRRITAAGSPTKFTARLQFRSVGLEWDGSWQLPHRLTYAPVVTPQKMRVQVIGKFGASSVYQVKFRPDTRSLEDTYLGSYAIYTGPTPTMIEIINSIATAINLDHGAVVYATSTVNDRSQIVLQVDALEYGHEFELTIEGSSMFNGGRWDAECTIGPIPDAELIYRVVTVDYSALEINDGDEASITLDGNTYTETIDAGGGLGLPIDQAFASIASQAEGGAVNISVVAGGAIITVTGLTPSTTFTVSGSSTSGSAVMTIVANESGTPERRGFEKSWGKNGFGWLAQATDRLKQVEAQGLADKSINRCFQLVCVDAADPSVKEIFVPGYPPKEVEIDFTAIEIPIGLGATTLSVILEGTSYEVEIDVDNDETVDEAVTRLAELMQGDGSQVQITHSGLYIWVIANSVGFNFTITASSNNGGDVTVAVLAEGIDNRYRVILLPSRPEPISPRPGDASTIDLTTGQAYAAETYNGYSVERPNIAFGSVSLGVLWQASLGWVGRGYFGNTAQRSFIPIPFQIVDRERQVIAFDRPVYRILGRGEGIAVLPPDLVIECGVMVLDLNYTPARYCYTKEIAGGTAPPIVRVFEDIQQEVIAQFDELHSSTSHTTLDNDAVTRGNYYTTALRDALQVPSGVHRKYGGCLSISLSGLTRQIGWKISKSGSTTDASTNSEFSKVIPPFAIRRRAENMPPDATRSYQNLMTDFRNRGSLNNAALALVGGGIRAGFSGV